MWRNARIGRRLFVFLSVELIGRVLERVRNLLKIRFRVFGHAILALLLLHEERPEN